MFRWLVLGCALVAVVASVGTAAGSGTAWPQPDVRDRALLGSILNGMGTDLSTARLTQLGTDWRKGRAAGTLELVTTSASRTGHARTIRADWDTLLIAHAYNERCLRSADHCVAVYSGPGGGGEAGRSGLQQPLWSAHALAQAIRQRFAAANLPVASISFEHPYALAPIITVRSSHPRLAYAAERKAWVALQPALRHSEGSFVQMFEASGQLFFVGAGSGNIGEGWCARFLQCPAP